MFGTLVFVRLKVRNKVFIVCSYRGSWLIHLVPSSLLMEINPFCLYFYRIKTEQERIELCLTLLGSEIRDTHKGRTVIVRWHDQRGTRYVYIRLDIHLKDSTSVTVQSASRNFFLET